MIFQHEEGCASIKCFNDHNFQTQTQVKNSIRLETINTCRRRSKNTKNFEELRYEPTLYHSNSFYKKLFVYYYKVKVETLSKDIEYLERKD